MLLNKALKSEFIVIEKANLYLFHTLLCQSILMEDDKDLQKVLRANLQLVIEKLAVNLQEYVAYLSSNLLMPARMQAWMHGT